MVADPLPSKWATVASDTNASSNATTPKKSDALPSKWATPVTSEKGKPLASRWAIDNSPSSCVPSKTQNSLNDHKHNKNNKNHNNNRSYGSKYNNEHDNRQYRPREHNNSHKKETHDDRAEASLSSKSFAARLDSLPVKNHSSPTKTILTREEDWEDDVEEEEEWEDDDGTDEKIAPTAAAKDFASRLGISIGEPEAPKTKSAPYRPPRSPTKEKQQSKNNNNNNKRKSNTGNTKKSVPEPEPEPEPEMTEEHRKKLEERDKLVDDMVSGVAKINWADLDDDDDDY